MTNLTDTQKQRETEIKAAHQKRLALPESQRMESFRDDWRKVQRHKDFHTLNESQVKQVRQAFMKKWGINQKSFMQKTSDALKTIGQYATNPILLATKAPDTQTLANYTKGAGEVAAQAAVGGASFFPSLAGGYLKTIQEESGIAPSVMPGGFPVPMPVPATPPQPMDSQEFADRVTRNQEMIAGAMSSILPPMSAEGKQIAAIAFKPFEKIAEFSKWSTKNISNPVSRKIAEDMVHVGTYMVIGSLVKGAKGKLEKVLHNKRLNVTPENANAVYMELESKLKQKDPHNAAPVIDKANEYMENLKAQLLQKRYAEQAMGEAIPAPEAPPAVAPEAPPKPGTKASPPPKPRKPLNQMSTRSLKAQLTKARKAGNHKRAAAIQEILDTVAESTTPKSTTEASLQKIKEATDARKKQGKTAINEAEAAGDITTRKTADIVKETVSLFAEEFKSERGSFSRKKAPAEVEARNQQLSRNVRELQSRFRKEAFDKFDTFSAYLGSLGFNESQVKIMLASIRPSNKTIETPPVATEKKTIAAPQSTAKLKSPEAVAKTKATSKPTKTHEPLRYDWSQKRLKELEQRDRNRVEAEARKQKAKEDKKRRKYMPTDPAEATAYNHELVKIQRMKHAGNMGKVSFRAKKEALDLKYKKTEPQGTNHGIKTKAPKDAVFDLYPTKKQQAALKKKDVGSLTGRKAAGAYSPGKAGVKKRKYAGLRLREEPVLEGYVHPGEKIPFELKQESMSGTFRAPKPKPKRIGKLTPEQKKLGSKIFWEIKNALANKEPISQYHPTTVNLIKRNRSIRNYPQMYEKVFRNEATAESRVPARMIDTPEQFVARGNRIQKIDPEWTKALKEIAENAEFELTGTVKEKPGRGKPSLSDAALNKRRKMRMDIGSEKPIVDYDTLLNEVADAYEILEGKGVFESSMLGSKGSMHTTRTLGADKPGLTEGWDIKDIKTGASGADLLKEWVKSSEGAARAKQFIEEFKKNPERGSFSRKKVKDPRSPEEIRKHNELSFELKRRYTNLVREARSKGFNTLQDYLSSKGFSSTEIAKFMASARFIQKIPYDNYKPVADHDLPKKTYRPLPGDHIKSPRPDYINSLGTKKYDQIPDMVVQALDDAYHGKSKATKPISNAQLERMAHDLGWSRKELKAFVKDYADKAPQVVAALSHEADIAMAAIHEYKQTIPSDPMMRTPEQIANFGKLFALNDVFDPLGKLASNTGRSLQYFKKQRNLTKLADIWKRATEEGHAHDIIDLMQKVDTTNPRAVSDAIKMLENPRFMDYVYSIYYNGILSGIPTHLVNTVSNATMFGLDRYVELPLKAAIDAPWSKITGKPREYYFKQAFTTVPWRMAIERGVSKAMNILARGDMSDMMDSKFFQELTGSRGSNALDPWLRSKWIPKKYRNAVSIANTLPTRALGAEDVIWKSVAYEHSLWDQAVRQIKHEFKESKQKFSKKAADAAIVDRYYKLATDEKAIKEAMYHANRLTFNLPSGKIGNLMMRLREYELGFGVRPVRHIMPFVRTPGNLIKEGLYRTPVIGAAMGKKAGLNHVDILARQSVGSALALWTWYKYNQGDVTGRAPKGTLAKEYFYNVEQNMAHSMQFGNTRVQIRRMEPLALSISLITSIGDAMKEARSIKEQNNLTQSEYLATLGSKAAFKFGQTITDASYLDTMAKLMAIATEADDRAGAALIQRMASSFLPWNSMLRSAVKATEVWKNGAAKVRYPKGIYQQLLANLPGLSEKVPSRIDLFGRDSEMQGGIFRQWFPYKWKNINQTPVQKELTRLMHDPNSGFNPTGKPATHIQGNLLTEQQQEQYARLYGDVAEQYLSYLYSQPYYKKQPPQVQAMMTRQMFAAARKQATGAMIATYRMKPAKASGMELKKLIPGYKPGATSKSVPFSTPKLPSNILRPNGTLKGRLESTASSYAKGMTSLIPPPRRINGNQAKSKATKAKAPQAKAKPIFIRPPNLKWHSIGSQSR